MISPNAEPIAHVSPYKRIELGARDKKPEPKWVEGSGGISPYDQLFREILAPGGIAPSHDVYGNTIDPKSFGAVPDVEEIYCG